MSVEDHLQPGEEILYRAHTSRITLAPYYLLLALALGAALAAWVLAESVPGTLVALGVAALVGIVVAWKDFVLRTNEYVLTNYRVIQQTGVFSKRSVDARLDKINNVEHRQSFWGRILGYGDLEIDTASETGTTRFPSIADPLELKRAVLAASEQYRTARTAPAAVPVFTAPATPAAVPAAQRLRELKALYDDGLISPEEYEEKRRRLMAEL